MAAVRFIISGGFLYALRRFKGDPRPEAAEWRSAVIIGIFLLVGGNGGGALVRQFLRFSLSSRLVAIVPFSRGPLDSLLSARDRSGLAAGGSATIQVVSGR